MGILLYAKFSADGPRGLGTGATHPNSKIGNICMVMKS